MAQISMATPFDSNKGKYAKTDQIYFKVRKFDENTFGVRMKHPATNEPPTEAQLVAQVKFKTLMEQVNTTLSDPERKKTLTAEWKAQKRCKTLRGYVFSKLSKSQTGGNENG